MLLNISISILVVGCLSCLPSVACLYDYCAIGEVPLGAANRALVGYGAFRVKRSVLICSLSHTIQVEIRCCPRQRAVGWRVLCQVNFLVSPLYLAPSSVNGWGIGGLSRCSDQGCEISKITPRQNRNFCGIVCMYISARGIHKYGTKIESIRIK